MLYIQPVQLVVLARKRGGNVTFVSTVQFSGHAMYRPGNFSKGAFGSRASHSSPRPVGVLEGKNVRSVGCTSRFTLRISGDKLLSVSHANVFLKGFVASILCSVLLCSCGFFPESTFELAPSSRLPKWFKPPHGLTREDVT